MKNHCTCNNSATGLIEIIIPTTSFQMQTVCDIASTQVMMEPTTTAKTTPLSTSYVNLMFNAHYDAHSFPHQENNWTAIKGGKETLDSIGCRPGLHYVGNWYDLTTPPIHPFHQKIPYPVNLTFDIEGDLDGLQNCAYKAPKTPADGAGMLVCNDGDFVKECAFDTDSFYLCSQSSQASGIEVSFWPTIKCAYAKS